MAENSLVQVIGMFLLSIFAGTIRFINKELNEFTIKALIINGATALFAGMLIYFFTSDISFIINNPQYQAGIIGVAGYMAPETLKFISTKYLDRLEK